MSTDRVDVDIGVIYSGERQWIHPLLESLSQSGQGVTMRLILVNNCADDQVHGLDELFQRHIVLQNTRREGYAANLNHILAASTATYLLALNTDMEFAPEEQCVARMFSFMEQNRRCGLGGCRILHQDGQFAHSARRFPTSRMIMARRLPVVRVFPAALGNYLYAERDEMETFECDWVSGCFMMIRRAASEQVGVFDDKYPKYFEDIDYCQRMQKHGWNVMYHGATYCYHFEKRASKQPLSRAAFAHLISYCRWLTKQPAIRRQSNREWNFAFDSAETRPS